MGKKESRKALGRGLSNLIPVKIEESEDSKNEIHEVSINSIKTNPFQPRIDFNDDEIRGLAESIKNQGLLQPVVVRQKGPHFEIISGERRYRAFQLLGRDSVPCIVKQEVSDREMLELALIENIQREELNEIEKAVAYRKLLLEYSYTHEQLADHIGKSRTAITNSLRLLNLPEEIQAMVRNGQISMGHARALLTIDENEQLEVAKRIVDEKLSVRDVEKMNPARKTETIKREPQEKVPTPADPDIINVIERLQYKFGTSVKIQNGSDNKGVISFRFFNNEDLTRIVELFLRD